MEEPKRVSFEEYERMEALSDERLEYYDGVVVRMESPSMRHELIVTNVGDALASTVRQKGCRKFTNATVITPGRPHGLKPDLAISCDAVDLGPGEHQRACRLRSPSRIVEVLSKSTSTVDLGDKVLEYGKIPSLALYLVIDSRRRWSVYYERMGDGGVKAIEEVVESLDTPFGHLSLEEMYEGVEVPLLLPLD